MTLKTTSSPSVLEPFIGQSAARYFDRLLQAAKTLPLSLIFTIASAATVGWIIGTRQYGLLDWLIAGSSLCLLIGLIVLAQSNLRLRILRRRHRGADVRGASDLEVLSRIEVLHFRGTAFGLAGATGLIAGGVALAFLGTAISAALIAILCFAGGVLVTSSLRRWDRRGFAVTAFVASAVSRPSSPQEAFERMSPAGEQRQAMLQVYGADESLRAGREVLAIVQDDRAYWPSLDNLPGHSVTARLVLRVRMLAELKWQIASVAVIALILAALVDFPFWPPLPGPNAAFSALVDALPDPETAEDEAVAENAQTEPDQESSSQNKDKSEGENDSDQRSGSDVGSDSQSGGEQGDSTSTDGDAGDAGTDPPQDSGLDEGKAGESQGANDGNQTGDASDGASDSDGDGVKDGEPPTETGDGESDGESDGGSESGDDQDGNSASDPENGQGDEPKDQSGQDSGDGDGDASGSDGNDQKKDAEGGDSNSGSDEGDGEDGSDSPDSDSGQGDDPNEQPGEGDDTGSEGDEPNDTSGDQAGGEDGAPSDQIGQNGSEAPTESDGAGGQGQASSADGGDGGAPSAGAEGGPSEGGKPAPDPTEPQRETGTEDLAPSGAQSSEPGSSGAGSPDQGTDGPSGAGDGTGAPANSSEPVPGVSAGGTASGGENVGPDGASEGAVEGRLEGAMNAAQGIDAAGAPGSLGEQTGLGELVETDTPQDDLPLVEGVRMLAPEGEVGISADLNHGSVVSLANPGGLAAPVEASPMTRNLSDEDLNGLEFPPAKQSLPAWISDLMQPQK